MKQISTLLLIALTAIVFTGCSENTVGGGMIQKRKYTKGFYLNRHSSGKAADNDATADVALPKEEKQAKIRLAAKKEDPVAKTTQQAAAAPASPEEYAAAVTTPRAQMQDEAPKAAGTEVSGDNPTVDVVERDGRQMRQSPVMEQKQMVQKEQHSAAAESAVLILLLVILAFFLPWLSVLLYEGATSRFWIILLLWLLAIIGFFWPIAYALAVIAVVFAILIVLGIV